MGQCQEICGFQGKSSLYRHAGMHFKGCQICGVRFGGTAYFCVTCGQLFCSDCTQNLAVLAAHNSHALFYLPSPPHPWAMQQLTSPTSLRAFPCDRCQGESGLRYICAESCLAYLCERCKGCSHLRVGLMEEVEDEGERGEKIGGGRFGDSLTDLWRAGDYTVVKVMKNKQSQDEQRYAQDSYIRQCLAYKAIHHPNFLQFHYQNPKQQSITIEYFQGDTLTAFMKYNPPLANRLRVMIKVAVAIAHLHGKGLGHYDVKPDNVMVRGRSVKLVDLGLTQDYLKGPEVVDQRFYSPLEKDNVGPWGDVMAFGMLLNFVLTGNGHYYDSSHKLVFNKAASHFSSLISRCVHEQPQKRPDMQAVLKQLDKYRPLVNARTDKEFESMYGQR